jgi:GNAT superfamily N-acetyltransferase
MGTRPAYQGHGAGALLLRDGIRRADAAGARVYVEASPEGRHLYQKFGFRDVAVSRVGFESGPDQRVQTYFMIREPEP